MHWVKNSRSVVITVSLVPLFILWGWRVAVAVVLVGTLTAISLTGYRSRVRQRAFETGGRRYLWALRGMLRSGVGLPEALSRLGEDSRGDAFTQAMHGAVADWKRGVPLDRALLPLATGGLKTGMRAVVVAYYRGRPLLPLLEDWLPRLERESDYRRRLTQMRTALGAQCLLVVLLPWGVALWAAGLPEPVLGGAVLFWQGLGLAVVYRVSRP